MRIYITGTPTKSGGASTILEKIADQLFASGIAVLSNVSAVSKNTLPAQEIALAEKRGEVLLDHMHAFIVDGSSPDSQTGYITAYAIFRKKHVLYLLPQKRKADQSLQMLAQNKSSSQFLHIRHWTDGTLPRHINDFLRRLSVSAKDSETPTIKFTLRITPSIDQYLSWRAKRSGAKKADFLRQMIGEEMEKDEYYKKNGESDNL